jgi:hypothetical protein
MPASVGLFLIIIFAVLMAIAVFLAVLFVVYRDHKILKASQVASYSTTTKMHAHPVFTSLTSLRSPFTVLHSLFLSVDRSTHVQLPLMCMVLSSMFFSAGRIVVAGVQVIPLSPFAPSLAAPDRSLHHTVSRPGTAWHACRARSSP